MTPFDSKPNAGAAAQVWSDELAELVGRTGIAGWLAQLGPWLGFGADVFPPKEPARFVEFGSDEKGIKVTLHYPFWDRAAVCDPENWAIHLLEYDACRAPLPFALDASRDTRETRRASSATTWPRSRSGTP